MFRTGFLQIIMVCVSTLTVLAAPPDQAAGPPNRYIAQVTDGFEPGQVGRGVAQRTGGKLVHVYTSAVKGFSIHLPPGIAKKDIESQSGVLMVEPDVQVYAIAQILPTGVDRIEADNSGVTAAVDVDIAIIDTGIDVDHPDLNVVGGRHFYSLWGFISFEDDAFDDDNGHGSHCAGIAAALNNNIGVVGVAPGARLWAVKVLDSSGSGYLSDVIAGVDWVTAHATTIEVANMSLAAIANSSIFRTAVQNSVNAGIFYAVAAGNDSTDVYGYDGMFGTGDDVIPAAYPEAAAISAMVDLDGKPGGGGGSVGYGSDDSFASFSNYSASVVTGNPVDSPGKAIDLLMPGVNIYSCYMNGGYATGSGTSMASPHAAGLAALYIASHGRANDADDVYAIRQALIDDGVAQTDSDGLAVKNDPDENMENIGWAISTEPPPSESPIADFVGNPTVGNAPLEVFFTDRSTGTITSWSWDFGDGGTSTTHNPSHTYDVGTYTVTLTVANDVGSDTETKTGYITVTEQAQELPVADFSASPTSGDAPLTVNFTDLSSGNPTSWSWDFDSDGIEDATAQNPSYTYSTSGVYTVTLTATNANGSDDEMKVDYINVNTPLSGPLVVDFEGSPTSGGAPLTVHFTDLSSGEPISWGWDFGDGIGASFEKNTSYTYNGPGQYNVTLIVMNLDFEMDMVTKYSYITVTGQTGNPPIADFSATPTSGEAPLAVQFTDLTTENPSIWSWDFGDGGASTLQNPLYIYDTPGTYTVTLTAVNTYGSDTVTKVDYVTVSEQPSGGITLTATGYKVKGRKTTNLVWSGATSTYVDIYRDGDLLDTIENVGTYTDATGSRGGGSFTYQVCEEGTSTCSNEVTVYY